MLDWPTESNKEKLQIYQTIGIIKYLICLVTSLPHPRPPERGKQHNNERSQVESRVPKLSYGRSKSHLTHLDLEKLSHKSRLCKFQGPAEGRFPRGNSSLFFPGGVYSLSVYPVIYGTILNTKINTEWFQKNWPLQELRQSIHTLSVVTTVK